MVDSHIPGQLPAHVPSPALHMLVQQMHYSIGTLPG